MTTALLSFLDGPDDEAEHHRGHPFLLILLLVIATEYVCRAIPKLPGLPLPYVVGTGLIVGLAILGLRPSWRRPALLGVAMVHAYVMWLEFPASANHGYLELVLCLLGACLGLDDPEQRTVFLRATRWLAVVVLFYSGLTKLVHGYYFHGEMLAYQLKLEPYRAVLGPLLPPAELARLAAFTGAAGDGPYRVASSFFVAVSNGIYVAEMLLALLLCLRPTRSFAMLAAIALFVAIEAGAREVFFGLVFVNMLLLFARRDLHRSAVGPTVAVLAVLLAAGLGAFGEVIFR